MMKKGLLTFGLAGLLALSLSACGGSTSDQPIGGDVIAPVTVGVNELQGTEIELIVGQMLNIDTESLAVDSYSGEVADPSVAEFVPGEKSGSAELNPGVTALAEGTTDVTMVSDQGSIQPLEFTVTVTSR